eukprot:gene9808-11457_t
MNSASWLQDFFLGEKIQEEKIFSIFTATYFSQQSVLLGHWSRDTHSSNGNPNSVTGVGSSTHNTTPISALKTPFKLDNSPSLNFNIKTSGILSPRDTGTNSKDTIGSGNIRDGSVSLSSFIQEPSSATTPPPTIPSPVPMTPPVIINLGTPSNKQQINFLENSIDERLLLHQSTTAALSALNASTLQAQQLSSSNNNNNSSNNNGSSSSYYHQQASNSNPNNNNVAIMSSPNSLLKPNEALFSNQKVLLKIINTKYPSIDVVSLFQREFAILSLLNNLDGVVRVIRAQTELGNIFAFILEDSGFKPLTSIYTTLGPTTPTTLVAQNNLSNSITGLANPTNAPFSLSPHTPTSQPVNKQTTPQQLPQHHTPQTSSPLFTSNLTSSLGKFQDIEVATFINIAIQHSSLLYLKNYPEIGRYNSSSFYYTSPEETGRTQHMVDYRSDLYSLGVTFFELMTGRLPFQTNDLSELIHAHLAKKAPYATDINPNVPKNKLLKKSPDDRYNSAYGLKRDLEICKFQLSSNCNSEDFILGIYDVLHRPHIPTELYSRKNELNLIFASIARVSKGNKELIFVSGHSGVGKTSLINAAKKKSPPGPRFISGKFDQYNRGVPYSAIIEALTELIHLVLVLSPIELAYYKEKLHRALGPNIGVIVNVIPILELVVGTCPPVPSLPPSESQNRFDLVFKDFLRVFSEEGHPLILFLDDLQRADEGSCRLIRLLLDNNNNLKYMLIVGAFRENELVDNMTKSIRAMICDDSLQIPITKINLKPLDLMDVNLMVSASLHKPPSETISLSEVVLSKTHGNPFFTIQFLKTLFNEDLLLFDVTRDMWKWDLTKIQTRQFTDNVVEFMVGNLQQLSLESQRVLQLASCIGTNFDLDILSIVAECPTEETLKLLTPIISQDLIINTDDKKYKFVHDRVQQAAYSLVLLGKEKKEIHLNIGRLLYQNPTKDESQSIFDIVNQYNVGLDLVTDSSERLMLSKLNYYAGKRAKSSAAYSVANSYLDCAVRTLTLETCWIEHYRISYDIFIEKSECEFMCGNVEESERLLEMVIDRSISGEDKGEAIALKVQQYTLLSKFSDCVENGIEYLNTQGIVVNRNPTNEELKGEYDAIKKLLGTRSFLDLFNDTHTPPPGICVSLKVMGIMIAPLFFTNIMWLSSLLLKIANLSIVHGCSSWSSVGLVMFGLIVCIGRFDDYNVGYECGRLAMELKERHNEPSTKGKVTLLFGNFINHWRAHMSSNAALIKLSFLESIESGDMGYACYSSVHLLFCSILAGAPLLDVYALSKKYTVFVDQYNFLPMLRILESHQHLLVELIGRDQIDNPPPPRDANDEKLFEEDILTLEIDNPKAFHFVFKMQGAYLLGHIDKAWEATLATERYIMGIYGHSPMALYYCFKSLILLTLYPKMPDDEHESSLDMVYACLERLETFAKHSFENYGMMVLIVRAELARVMHRYVEAMELFGEAVSVSQTHKYVQYEALSNELAGRMYFTMGKMAVARAYLLEAQLCYSMWGASTKASLLESEFPVILGSVSSRTPLPNKLVSESVAPLEPRLSIRRRSQDSGSKKTSTSYPQVDAFDLCSVITVSHSLAEEIYYDRLLKRLMKVVIRNAGASRGYLLLLEDSNKELFPNNNHLFGELNVAASACVTGEKVNVEIYINCRAFATASPTPVELSPSILSPGLRNAQGLEMDEPNKAVHDDGTWNLCVSMVNYVRRTQSPLLICNAHDDKTFCDDPYVRLARPKSVLVLPIVHQGKLVSILYLENNFTTGAFTTGRMEVLNLLSTQIAVSFQNARLFLQSNHLANQAFLAKEEAEKANKAKSDFISNMSHEMRTPLNHIIGSLELLREFPLTNDQKELLTISQQSSESLLFMVNNILDLSKVEQGKTVLNFNVFNLVSFLEDSIGAIAPNAHQKGLMVGLCCTPCTASIPVIADMNLLRQVLVNLLSNAIKFTCKGEVYIRVFVEQSPTNAGVYLTTVEVTDSGIGIKQRDFEKLFQRFSQIDTGVNRAYDGSGLGLSICKQLVELMNGKIGIRSKIGEGSVFYFTLEMARAKEDIAPACELSVRRKSSVVIVEDNPMICEQVSQIVQSIGIDTCRTAAFSETNISHLVSSATCDEGVENTIVIIGLPLNYNEDHVMTLIDNIRLIKGKKNSNDLPPLPRIDFIVITQLALTTSRSILQDSDILLVNRPIKRESLLKTISKIMDSHEAIIQAPPTFIIDQENSSESPIYKLSTPSSPRDGMVPSSPRPKLDISSDHPQLSASTISLSSSPTQRDRDQQRTPPTPPDDIPIPTSSDIVIPPIITRKTPQVLVIEDNELNANILFRMLQKIGISTPDLALNGAEGVEKASNIDYDLILMDIQMPIMDGYEATSRIRRREGSKKHTPIVAMTANAMGGQREACDLEIELWPKEAPKAVRNFVQLCLEHYYDGCIFHRVIKQFIAQTGDPTGTGEGGESIYNGEPFKDEFHSRLRFTRRGLLEVDENDMPLFPPKILGTQVVWNPYEDMVPRSKAIAPSSSASISKDIKEKTKKKAAPPKFVSYIDG